MATNDIYNSDNTLAFDQTQTDVENTVDKKDDKQALKRAAAVAGLGIGAAAMGAGGMAVAQTLMNAKNEEEEVVVDDTVTSIEAQGVTDDMSFAEAFDHARAELGPGGIFHWHGQAYNTYTKEEWDQMSKEERDAYADRVSDNISSEERSNYQAHQQHSGNHNDHHHASNTTTGGSSTTQTAVGGTEDDADVVIIGVQDVQTEDGQVVTVGAARIDDYDVVVVDSNHDGTFDVAAVDANQNGQFDQDEYISLENQNVTVEGFQRMGHQNDIAAREEIMGNVPNDDDNSIPDTDYLASNDLPDYSQDYGVDDTFIA